EADPHVAEDKEGAVIGDVAGDERVGDEAATDQAGEAAAAREQDRVDVGAAEVRADGGDDGARADEAAEERRRDQQLGPARALDVRQAEALRAGQEAALAGRERELERAGLVLGRLREDLVVAGDDILLVRVAGAVAVDVQDGARWSGLDLEARR